MLSSACPTRSESVYSGEFADDLTGATNSPKVSPGRLSESERDRARLVLSQFASEKLSQEREMRMEIVEAVSQILADVPPVEQVVEKVLPVPLLDVVVLSESQTFSEGVAAVPRKGGELVEIDMTGFLPSKPRKKPIISNQKKISVEKIVPTVPVKVPLPVAVSSNAGIVREAVSCVCLPGKAYKTQRLDVLKNVKADGRHLILFNSHHQFLGLYWAQAPAREYAKIIAIGPAPDTIGEADVSQRFQFTKGEFRGVGKTVGLEALDGVIVRGKSAKPKDR